MKKAKARKSVKIFPQQLKNHLWLSTTDEILDLYCEQLMEAK